MGAEEREHARRGDDADGLPAKEKAVPAVRKSPPCHRTAARRQAAAIDRSLRLCMRIERSRPMYDTDGKDACDAENKGDGDALHKERAAHRNGVRKTADCRQNASQQEGEREKYDRRQDMRAHTAARCRQREYQPARNFHDISRPYGKAKQGKQKRLAPSQYRGGDQPRKSHLHPRTDEREIEKKPVQKKVFQKNVFDIDRHIRAP